ncbi:hypothetical protein D7207_36380 [Burkholderia cepacia]|nr:hypothetical protein [Burkholderia cepacia]MBA9979143.1 hypothetical protein [Burkholderia cepacia]MBA9997827.1 hypothetical protein [Burkholderia cepacia]MBB0005872.1 hypothetical protein [Burkholderia cepacia]MBB0013511.1 hypothetical protein [Burkholderia cepacia]
MRSSYNEKHPYIALKYGLPRVFRRAMDSATFTRGCVRIYRGGLKSEVQHLSHIRCCNAQQNFVSAAST